MKGLHQIQITITITILSRYQKNMQSDSTTIYDIIQQLNNIEVCHIYIFNIAEYNAYNLLYSE